MDTKHLFLVEGSGIPAILKMVMKKFKQPDFFFIIHWDKKQKQPDFSMYSNAVVIDSIPVYWGTDTQVLAERRLFEATKMFSNFEWVHLISESDVPLMRPDYFLEYFKNREFSDVEFDGYANQYNSRIKYYMPIRSLEFKNNFWGLNLHRVLKIVNKFLRVNRLKKFEMPIYKGSNWVSLNKCDLKKVIEFDDFKAFLNSSLADELYVQTILGEEFLDERIEEVRKDSRYMLKTSRFIDWNRGNPYEFKESDFLDLAIHLNTEYTFVRKIKSVILARKLLNL